MLETAIEAAAEAGKLLRKTFGTQLAVNQATHYDIKLEIDEQSQKLITRVILADFPDHCILGEEGVTGRTNADVRWVVDPLDGTVNYFYGIPHYAVSIAAQVKTTTRGTGATTTPGVVAAVPAAPAWETVAGVVLDPELDELFATAKGKPAMLHGHPIHASNRTQLSESIVAMAFFKSTETINRGLEGFSHAIHKVRKMRLMGAAALDIAYVACGRYDAYIEHGVRLWDITAGKLLVENAGGCADVKPHGDVEHAFDVRMWNGKMPVEELLKPAEPRGV
jgi:myo-inositol-1(or 4)-monophosphatase